MLIQFTLLLPALESKHSIQWYKKFSPLVRTGVDFIADFFQSRSITTFKIMANFVCVFKSQLSSIHLKLLCVQCTYISLPIPTHHAYSALPEVRILILTPFYLLIESNFFYFFPLQKTCVSKTLSNISGVKPLFELCLDSLCNQCEEECPEFAEDISTRYVLFNVFMYCIIFYCIWFNCILFYCIVLIKIVVYVCS